MKQKRSKKRNSGRRSNMNKNQGQINDKILKPDRHEGNFILSSTPPNEDNKLDDFKDYRNTFGSLCFDNEISKVPIFTKTSDGIEVVNRITLPYTSKNNPNDPESGYDLAYHIWFNCLNIELEKISKRDKDIELCLVTGDKQDPKGNLDYITILDCDTIEEAKQLISELPSLIETRMERGIYMIMNGPDSPFEPHFQQNE